MNEKIKFGLLGSTGSTYVSLAATGIVANNVYNTAADVDLHIKIYRAGSAIISYAPDGGVKQEITTVYAKDYMNR